MTRRHWMLTVPLLLMLLVGGRLFLGAETTNGANQRITDPHITALSEELGFHLYAPTYLPHEGTVGPLGLRRGKHRILQDFSDRFNRSVCILAQEKRNDSRDGYHRRLFQERAEATAMVGDAKGYFITGTNGERRLFWNQDEVALILSSSVLSDEELLKVACELR